MENKKKIVRESATIGDYVYVDGYSGFCQGCYEKITGIETRYDEKTGKPYKVVITDNDSVYRFSNGECLKGATAYHICSYAKQI